MFGSTTARNALLLSLAAVQGVLAVPEVTVSGGYTGCGTFPGWNNDTKIAGPWTVQLEYSGNPAIEGFSDTVGISRGSTGIRWGYITFPTDNTLAKTPLQCADNTLQARVPTGVSGSTWQPLVIASIPYDSTLIYGVEGSQPKLFQHLIDGVLQKGAYIGGYENSTTWGLRYFPADDSSFGTDYYYIRLLGPDSADPSTGLALFPGEVTAFIKITGF